MVKFDHINENTDFVYHDLAIVNGQSGLFKRKKLKHANTRATQTERK